jgi:hypothetical protein
MFCFGFPAIGGQLIRANQRMCVVKLLINQKTYLEHLALQVFELEPFQSSQLQQCQCFESSYGGMPSIGYTTHSCSNGYSYKVFHLW